MRVHANRRAKDEAITLARKRYDACGSERWQDSAFGVKEGSRVQTAGWHAGMKYHGEV